MTAADLARAYYAAIDQHDYDTLASLLATDFTQHRSDRTLSGADRFVQFMREERPMTDTTHEIEGIYDGPGGVAVHGRLVSGDGDDLFTFVDVFDADADRERLLELRTFSE